VYRRKYLSSTSRLNRHSVLNTNCGNADGHWVLYQHCLLYQQYWASLCHLRLEKTCICAQLVCVWYESILDSVLRCLILRCFPMTGAFENYVHNCGLKKEASEKLPSSFCNCLIWQTFVLGYTCQVFHLITVIPFPQNIYWSRICEMVPVTVA
jgi:hypothetical protein